MADLKGFKNERSKKRRHSYSSASAFAARPSANKQVPLSPAHSLTSSLRTKNKRDVVEASGRLQSVSSQDRRDGDSKGSRRKSFVDLFRSKTKRRNLSLPEYRRKESTSSVLSEDKTVAMDPLLEQTGEFVRVVATTLHPQIYYKTLRITQYTTVYEVIVKLVGKFANSPDDQNPDIFYMTEVRESDQGSYSRVLENSDRVYEIQSRWEDGKKCSFTLCRKEIIKAGDDPFLENPINAMVLSPSQDSFYSGFPGLIDVEVPNTPASPNSLATKFSFFEGPSVVDHFYKSVLPISPSESSDTMETGTVGISTRESPQQAWSESATTTDTTEVSSNNDMFKHNTSDVNKLMQQSISEGMLGIMTKVVTESKQRPNSPAKGTSRLRQRRATVALTADDILPSSSPARLARKNREDVLLMPLVYSPMESARKRFPELIVTPKDSASVEEGSCDSLNFSLKDSKARVDNGPYPIHSEKEEVKKNKSGRFPKSNLPLVNHHKTSHSVPIVKFATNLIVHPRYFCSASIFPSFSRNTRYRTEMDISKTLTSMLETKFIPHSEKHFSTGSLSSSWIKNSSYKKVNRHREGHFESQDDVVKSSSTQNLVQKAEQWRQGNRPIQKVIKSKLQRPHTFHVRREHLQLHSLNQDPENGDHFVARAALAIQQRNYQRQSLRLSESECLPRHIRVSNSSLSHKGSTSSIPSEVESDLDALLDLQSKRLSSCCGSSEQSLTSTQLQHVHMRTDSDGILQTVNNRGSRFQRESSSDSIGSVQRLQPPYSQLRRLSAPSKSEPYTSPSLMYSSSHLSHLIPQATILEPNGDMDGYFLNKETSNTSNEVNLQTPQNLSHGNALYKSVEVISTSTQSIISKEDREQSDNDPEKEVLYTFQSNIRPITVLVRCKSSVALNSSETELKETEKENKLRTTKSSVNLARSNSEKNLESQEEATRLSIRQVEVQATFKKEREMWNFNKRRWSSRKIKRFSSEL